MCLCKIAVISRTGLCWTKLACFTKVFFFTRVVAELFFGVRVQLLALLHGFFFVVECLVILLWGLLVLATAYSVMIALVPHLLILIGL